MEFLETESEAIVDRQIVPAGVHAMVIIAAEEGTNEWKVSDANPTGECLKLRLSLGDYKFVFHDIPKHHGGVARQLAAALGIDVDSQLAIEPNDLIGRTVSVEVVHYTSKAGKTSAVVKKYVVPEASKPGKRPAAKKAVPVPVDQDPDDIPF